MCVSATIEGFDVEDGDMLVAYADGEVVGSEEIRVNSEALESRSLATEGAQEIATDQPVHYLTIGGDKQANIWFAIERNGEIMVSTRNVMSFRADDVVGTPDKPFAINFSGTTGIGLVEGGYKPGKWYTVGGVQLPNRPKQKGVYIYNNNKVVIK